MTRTTSSDPAMAAGAQARPVIGFLLFGGPLSGALVRDVRLANELTGRGFEVHAWWAMDRPKDSPLLAQVHEHWLFNGLRYLPVAGLYSRGLKEAIGRFLTSLHDDRKRARALQKRPVLLRRLMESIMLHICAGVERDPRVLRRFVGELEQAGVTHLLPMLGMLCPWAAAAKRRMRRPLKFLVTIQGYELYINYARSAGCEREFFQRLLEAVEESGWPAIAVSEDYVERVVEDIGLPRERLRAIPPGVPPANPMPRERAARLLAERFPEFRADVPLVSYLGRRDAEKGLDLLLYSVTILRRRGLDVQLAVCGPTLFGTHYSAVCAQLAEDLRCPVLWAEHIPDELRTALFVASRCLVYPSIHREPFGMVPVEALAHGTPAVVPDYGGVGSAIQANGECGGLHFRVWDSGDLADRIAELITDENLHRRLANAGPRVAEYHSVANLADRVLAHIGLPPRP